MNPWLRLLLLSFLCHHCKTGAAFLYGSGLPVKEPSPPRTPSSFVARKTRLLHLSTQNDNNNNESTSDGQNNPTIDVITPIVGSAIVVTSIAWYADAWHHLITSFAEMKLNSAPADFTNAFTFWLFGALSHPLLTPIFELSEILHACPGPKLAGLVPFSFLIPSGGVVWLISTNPQVRVLAGSLAVALLFNSIGAGLDGELPGDYNIQLDDSYQGQIVKGCPAPDDDHLVRSLPERGFDYQNYQGKWYWQKVHDWTQFHEMYDSTLDISLTDTGYINTLTIKGPSPSNSPLSWDKSPLMNGVKYSWVGIVDKQSPSGTSVESGFGVTFPNYIVDVKTDKRGNYEELIQFQCIQLGGVRLYEGIDFMSRNQIVSEAQLDGMHQRAHDAGLDPYGAAPEQMHRIQQQRVETNPNNEENEWQRLWQNLGMEQYLDQSLK